MSDLFGGLNGLIKGFSNFMPQDDPDVKLMTAQSELSDLQRQEKELYEQIGKQVLAMESGRFPEIEGKLKLIQTNIQATEEKIKSAQAEKEAKDAAQQAKEQERTCSNCGYINPDGVKFCQECGGKLGLASCHKCGAKLAHGIRFCGECGAKQEV